VTGPDGNATYGYDPVGNRTSKVAGATTSYTYDRADGILTAGATSFSVNANGNTTAKGADTFIYDQPNRLKTATVSGTAETYAYDGDGTRFSRQIGSGSPIRYVSDVNRGLPVAVDDGTRKYVYGLGLAYAVNGSSLEVYHTDRLGSIRALTDATGSVSATYRTDEWGTVTAQTGSSTQPFGFTGEPRDATGLTYLRARYYDPALGRFLSRDPWPGTPSSCQTLNRYVYGGNNPATFGDPSGLKSQVLGGGGIDLSGVLPCDPIQTAVGVVGVVVGGYAVAEGLVSIFVTGGLAAPFGGVSVAAGVYAVGWGLNEFRESYQCRPQGLPQ
jgi:RHS repeat-associated protein